MNSFVGNTYTDTDEMFDEHDMLIKNDPILHNIFFLFDYVNIEYSIRTLLETHSLDLVIIDAYSDVFGEEMNQSNQVRKFLNDCNLPIVVKADGLAAGKGVTICKTKNQVIKISKDIFKGKFKSSKNFNMTLFII